MAFKISGSHLTSGRYHHTICWTTEISDCTRELQNFHIDVSIKKIRNEELHKYLALSTSCPMSTSTKRSEQTLEENRKWRYWYCSKGWVLVIKVEHVCEMGYLHACFETWKLLPGAPRGCPEQPAPASGPSGHPAQGPGPPWEHSLAPAAPLRGQGHQGPPVTALSPRLPGPVSWPCCCCQLDPTADRLPRLLWGCWQSLPATIPALTAAPRKNRHAAAHAVGALSPSWLTLAGAVPLKLLPDIKCNEQLYSSARRPCGDSSHKCVKAIHPTTDS